MRKETAMIDLVIKGATLASAEGIQRSGLAIDQGKAWSTARGRSSTPSAWPNA
jgi:hypothetical protein